MGERLELIIRIPLAIIYGIILGIWGLVVGIVAIVHWFYTLIRGKRHLGMAKFTNRYITYSLLVSRYLYLITNERPWPIGKKGPEEVLPVDIR